jgi:hypothetical protein
LSRTIGSVSRVSPFAIERLLSTEAPRPARRSI